MTPIDSFYAVLEPTLKKVGKTSKDVKLIVASKYYTIEQIVKLYDMGQRDFGENRVQDALEKIPKLPGDIRWHFFGHLQKNKVNKILDLFDLIHSIDSIELAEKMSEKSQKQQKILLQVNTSGETSKGGFAPDQLGEALKEIQKLPRIDVCGLMTMAPHGDNESIVRKAFADLKKLKDRYGAPSWDLSMGMSSDCKIAIEEGSTCLRVGRYFLPLI